MSWRSDLKTPGIQNRPTRSSDSGASLWTKCLECGAILYRIEIERNSYVCLKCNYHFSMPARKRLELLLDAESFVEYDADLQTEDPLQFIDQKTYSERLESSKKRSGEEESCVWGSGTVKGMPVSVACFVFEFMGGSMGSVAGEKVTRCFEYALQNKTAAIVISASGGARMQEGIISLMQMAKTCAALEKLKEAGLPYISILANPTTGGVAASFAMLGDFNISEPCALIGFAGPRVIEQTIRQTLPEGFQKAPFLLEHGTIDEIVDRREHRDYIGKILELLKHQLAVNS